jgi:hypothetical protein
MSSAPTRPRRYTRVCNPSQPGGHPSHKSASASYVLNRVLVSILPLSPVSCTGRAPWGVGPSGGKRHAGIANPAPGSACAAPHLCPLGTPPCWAPCAQVGGVGLWMSLAAICLAAMHDCDTKACARGGIRSSTGVWTLVVLLLLPPLECRRTR